jgi:hypothetical protein
MNDDTINREDGIMTTNAGRGEGSRRTPRMAAASTFVLCVGAGVLLSGCGDLLTPENPGEILAEDLQNPNALPILLNGVAGDFNYLYSYAMLTVGHFANEVWHTGSMSGWRELNRGIVDPQDAMGTVYNRATKANWVADNAAALILEAFEDGATRPELAKARIYAGFSQLILADNFCAITVSGSAPMTPTEIYQLAKGHFTEAVTIATGANSATLRLQALAGRARVNLMLGQFQAARDDAIQIPDDWVFEAIYSQNSGREENFVPSHTVARFRKEAGVDPRFFNDPRYATDPRLNFKNGGPTVVGEDRIRQFVEQTKYPERFSNGNISSWQEVRLIEAEAELELGNTNRAIELIDEVRAAAPLPAYDGPATKADVMDQIMFERSVELFLEAKHLVDLRRTNDPLLNGRADCAPISWAEQESNNNVK